VVQEIPCSVKYVNDWDEAKSLFEEIPSGWAFRGQCQSNWTLKTSLERVQKRLLIADAEEFLFHEFKRRAHNYLKNTLLPNTPVEWLALMQHCGTPTRLLDWTMSPYVASYFALEGAENEDDSCAVWGANLSWFKIQGIRNVWNSIESFHHLESTTDLSHPEYFVEIFFKKRVRLVVPIEPYLLNERFAIQQGAFLCIGDVELGFVGNLLSYDAVGSLQIW
jgi:hypothetical protein